MKPQVDWSKVAVKITKLEPGPKRQGLRFDKVTSTPYKAKGEIARLNELARRGKA